MESVIPEFAPSHRKIEFARTIKFFSSLAEVSNGFVALSAFKKNNFLTMKNASMCIASHFLQFQVIFSHF